MPKYQAYTSMRPVRLPICSQACKHRSYDPGMKGSVMKGSVMKSIGECVTNNFQHRDNELTDKVRDEVI